MAEDDVYNCENKRKHGFFKSLQISIKELHFEVQ